MGLNPGLLKSQDLKKKIGLFSKDSSWTFNLRVLKGSLSLWRTRAVLYWLFTTFLSRRLGISFSLASSSTCLPTCMHTYLSTRHRFFHMEKYFQFKSNLIVKVSMALALQLDTTSSKKTFCCRKWNYLKNQEKRK